MKRQTLFIASAPHDDPTVLVNTLEPLIDRGVARWVTKAPNPVYDMWLAFHMMGQLPARRRIMSADVVLLLITQRFMHDPRCIEKARALFSTQKHMTSARIIPIAFTHFEPRRMQCPQASATPLVKPIDQYEHQNDGWRQVRHELAAILTSQNNSNQYA